MGFWSNGAPKWEYMIRSSYIELEMSTHFLTDYLNVVPYEKLPDV